MAKTQKATDRFASLLNSVDVHLKVERRGGGLHDTEHGGYNVHVAEAVCKLRRCPRCRLCIEQPWAPWLSPTTASAS